MNVIKKYIENHKPSYLNYLRYLTDIKYNKTVSMYEVFDYEKYEGQLTFDFNKSSFDHDYVKIIDAFRNKDIVINIHGCNYFIKCFKVHSYSESTVGHIARFTIKFYAECIISMERFI